MYELSTIGRLNNYESKKNIDNKITSGLPVPNKSTSLLDKGRARFRLLQFTYFLRLVKTGTILHELLHKQITPSTLLRDTHSWSKSLHLASHTVLTLHPGFWPRTSHRTGPANRSLTLYARSPRNTLVRLNSLLLSFSGSKRH